MKSKLILGDGLLGSELVKQTGWDYVSRKNNKSYTKYKFDITNPNSFNGNLNEVYDGCAMAKKYDVIINCIAHTDTYSTDKDLHWKVNYEGVNNLIEFCNEWKIKLVHISSDYIYTHSVENAKEDDVPVHCRNWYGYTKLLSDGLVQLRCDDYLLLRGTHKVEPFTYDSAWSNQVGNFDYVSTMSEIIVKLINKDCKGVYNIGTQTKSMYELAKKTKLNVKCDKNQPENVPKNVTMNLGKLKKIIQYD